MSDDEPEITAAVTTAATDTSPAGTKFSEAEMKEKQQMDAYQDKANAERAEKLNKGEPITD